MQNHQLKSLREKKSQTSRDRTVCCNFNPVLNHLNHVILLKHKHRNVLRHLVWADNVTWSVSTKPLCDSSVCFHGSGGGMQTQVTLFTGDKTRCNDKYAEVGHMRVCYFSSSVLHDRLMKGRQAAKKHFVFWTEITESLFLTSLAELIQRRRRWTNVCSEDKSQHGRGIMNDVWRITIICCGCKDTRVWIMNWII